MSFLEFVNPENGVAEPEGGSPTGENKIGSQEIRNRRLRTPYC
jgi:hypothetical protein